MTTILGLDIGSDSIGWALLQFDENKPTGVIDCGVRLFESGIPGYEDTRAKQSPRAERGVARRTRRLVLRRKRRLVKTLHILQGAGFLESSMESMSKGPKRYEFLLKLDKRIAKEVSAEVAQSPAGFVYFLRKEALSTQLPLHQLARVFLHLAQRRGFKSNRLSDSAEEDIDATGEPSKRGKPKKTKERKKETVKPAIEGLRSKMGDKTLGEYFASIDPMTMRIRDQHTGREMYEEEFERIWAAQREFDPDLFDDELYEELYHAIFDQRPLKSSKKQAGWCQFERGERRISRAMLYFQRFRILQKVNDLRINQQGEERPLSQEEREKLIDLLGRHDKLKYSTIRKELKIKGRTKFNLEYEGSDDLLGDVTSFRIRDAVGRRWDDLSPDDRNRLVGELTGISDEKTIVRRAIKPWKLDAESARKLAKVRLEKGQGKLSKKAIRKLMPFLETGVLYGELEKHYAALSALPAKTKANVLRALKAGVPYSELARKLNFREVVQESSRPTLDKLPPLSRSRITVRNHAVMRILTELRKVVNELKRVYGRPDKIRVELARELRHSKKARERIVSQNTRFKKERENAQRKLSELNVKDTGLNRLKYRLAEECSRRCPYTGENLSWDSIFVDGTAQIEHIWPWSRTFDDSYENLTLASTAANKRKGNQTPYEAYSNPQEEWKAIVGRVKAFNGDAKLKKRKLDRFLAREIDGDLADRFLNDTKEASVVARRYLGLLYGSDAFSSVQVGNGRVTAILRDIWDLNAILGDPNRKERKDHRHHAIDAIVTALVDHRVIGEISRASAQERLDRGYFRSLYKKLPLPWDGFKDAVEVAKDEIVTSHRPNHRVRGPLHEENLYNVYNKDMNRVRYRAKVGEFFKKKEGKFVKRVEKIISPAMQQVITSVRSALSQSDSAGVDQLLQKHNPHGRPIRAVVVEETIKTEEIGIESDGTFRNVKTGGNHHMAIYASKDKKGCTYWDFKMVTRLDAHRRLSENPKRPVVVDRDPGDGKVFQFSLTSGDLLEMQLEGPCTKGNSAEKVSTIFVVRTISGGNVEVCGVDDARKKTDIKKAGGWTTIAVESLRKLKARKVTISPIGEVYPAND